MTDYKINIGLEIHVELKTKTKIFCSCKNAFGDKPNTNICPICLGFPATLPAVNKNAVILAIKAGLVFGSRISPKLLFDRKHYFYPDLPKAYQISQDKLPLCIGGGIKLDSGKYIRFKQIHLEEDAGKLIHDPQTNQTFIDFNRAGLPLIECVTEIDIENGDEAVEFLTKLKQKLNYANISDCKMERGQMRCDVNVSANKTDAETLGTKVEMKNLSSFKAVKLAIDYESKRQIDELNHGHKIIQETRKWDESKGISTPMRKKEKAQDYRYMPEPDFISINISPKDVEEIKNTLPLDIDEKLNDYMSKLGLNENYAKQILSDNQTTLYFENCLKILPVPVELSNWIVNELLGFKTNTNSLQNIIKEEYFCSIINLCVSEKISRTLAKKLLEETIKTNQNPLEIMKKSEFSGNYSEKQICAYILSFLKSNPEILIQFKNSNKKDNILNFIVGFVMNQSNGKADPKLVKDCLQKIMHDKYNY